LHEGGLPALIVGPSMAGQLSESFECGHLQDLAGRQRHATRTHARAPS